MEWADLMMATTDLPDALRGLPLAPEDQRAAVVAVWHAKRHEWMFSIMDGCPFGLGAVVVQFNRYPALLVAVARRLYAFLTAAYFDDCVQLEPQISAVSASEAYKRLMGQMGTPPKPSKRFGMATHRVFLGAAITAMRSCEEAAVIVAPKEATRANLTADLTHAITTHKLTPAAASKIF